MPLQTFDTAYGVVSKILMDEVTPEDVSALKNFLIAQRDELTTKDRLTNKPVAVIAPFEMFIDMQDRLLMEERGE